MKKSILIILSIFVFFTSCASTSTKNNVSQNSSVSDSLDFPETKSIKNSYKGKDLVIAVTPPVLNNDSKSNSWIPQYFQDSLTGKFAQFSKMTVLDRKNELLIKAEQELSESGYYSEENALQIGQMTNAQFVVVGNIQQISGNYEVNFRVNDATTNEIKASSNNRYSLSDLQSGKAVNETTQNLLEGLGIELSASEKLALSKVNKIENQSTMNLAKGNAAEKSDDFMDALLFYIEAEKSSATSNEAKNNISNLFGTNSLSAQGIQNLKAQNEYANFQVERWNKIFTALDEYLDKNLSILVYDFSQSIVSSNFSNQTVKFTVSPGLKVVPDRNALLLANRIMQEWERIANDKKSNPWIANVKYTKCFQYPYRDGVAYSAGVSFFAYLGFYDETGYRLKETDWMKFGGKLEHRLDNIKSQKGYFDESKYRSVVDTLKYDELPEQGDVIFKVSRVRYLEVDGTPTVRIMSIDEYNDWAKNQ